MSATLCIDVDNIDVVTSRFNVLKVYRSDAASGPFIEATTPSTRIPLASGRTRYVFEDADGTPLTYYTTSYYNTETRQESSQSAPVQCGDAGEQLLIDVETLKRDYLFGLQLTDRQGNPLPDSIFARGIRTAVAWIQRRLGLQLTPIEVQGERHDIRITTSGVLPLCTVDILPVRTVRRIDVVYPGTQASSIDLLPEHLNVSEFDGRIEYTRGAWLWANAVRGGAGAFGYGYNSNGWTQAGVALFGTRRAPGAVRVDYAAGFTKATLPADILDLVAKAAALSPLSVAGDLQQPFGIGSSSIGFDGLSQSISRNSPTPGGAYAARYGAYTTQIDAEVVRIRSYYRSLQLRVA